MTSLRFNHVYLILLLLAGLGSLVVPARVANLTRGHVDFVVAPVARPSGLMAAWVTNRFRSRDGADPEAWRDDASRKSGDLHEELNNLRATVAVLSEEIARLEEHQANLRNIGPAGEFCRPFEVNFADAASRDSLSLRADSAVKVQPGMAVLTPDSLVGRVAVAGLSAVQVRLITDRESWVRVSFRRLQQLPDGRYAFAQVKTERVPVLQGLGGDRMAVLNLHMAEVQAASLAEGDWVVLQDDGDWPKELQGMPIGRVDKIEPQSKATWFAQVNIRPRKPLKELRSVMIMAK